jgi:hypothetical protein
LLYIWCQLISCFEGFPNCKWIQLVSHYVGVKTIKMFNICPIAFELSINWDKWIVLIRVMIFVQEVFFLRFATTILRGWHYLLLLFWWKTSNVKSTIQLAELLIARHRYFKRLNLRYKF